jgi:hypothetical protein
MAWAVLVRSQENETSEGYRTHGGDTVNAYTILVGKFEEKRPLLGVDWKTILK